MPRPPAAYKPEPGERVCGDSWWRAVTATGEIEHANGFGDDLSVRIEPIQQGLTPERIREAGRLEAWEADLRHAIRERVEAIVEDRGLYPILTGDDWKSIRFLLDGALSELDSMTELYDKWIHRDGGSWSLARGDELEDFPPFGRNNQACTPGFRDVDGVRVDCPSAAERSQRKIDRREIREHLLNALRFMRCAEWSMHRTRLRREALDALLELPDGDPHKRAWLSYWASQAAAGIPGRRPGRVTPDALRPSRTGPMLPDPDGLGEGEPDTGSGPTPRPEAKGMSTALKVVAGAGAAVILYNLFAK